MMPAVQINMPVDALLEACRSLHEAAKREARAGDAATRSEEHGGPSGLHETFVNLLHQTKSQFSHPFIAGIPEGDSRISAQTLPALTAQLLAALQGLASPLLTPQAILAAWDNPIDADYDDI